MGFLFFPCIIRDGLISTPTFRTCRNYYPTESEAELTVETLWKDLYSFPFFGRGEDSAGVRVYCTLVYRPVGCSKIHSYSSNEHDREKRAAGWLQQTLKGGSFGIMAAAPNHISKKLTQLA